MFIFLTAPTISLTPEELIIFDGNVATFFCASNVRIDFIEWTLNGRRLTDMHVSNPMALVQESFGTLVFSGKSAMYSNTTIRCTVRIRASKLFLSSGQTILRVQGTLELKTLECEHVSTHSINFNVILFMGHKWHLVILQSKGMTNILSE